MTNAEREQLRDWCESTADSYGISADRWPAFVNEVADKILTALDSAENWKREAMQVLNYLDLQTIGEELGLPLGSEISAQVLPGIRELKARADSAEGRVKELEAERDAAILVAADSGAALMAHRISDAQHKLDESLDDAVKDAVRKTSDEWSVSGWPKGLPLTANSSIDTSTLMQILQSCATHALLGRVSMSESDRYSLARLEKKLATYRGSTTGKLIERAEAAEKRERELLEALKVRQSLAWRAVHDAANSISQVARNLEQDLTEMQQLGMDSHLPTISDMCGLLHKSPEEMKEKERATDERILRALRSPEVAPKEKQDE